MPNPNPPTTSSKTIHCPNCEHPIGDHNDNGCNGPWRCDCGYVDYQIRDANKKPTTSSGDALELEAELKIANDDAQHFHDLLEAANSKLATAIEALREYGQHKPKCALKAPHKYDVSIRPAKRECDCGFAVLTSLEGERKP